MVLYRMGSEKKKIIAFPKGANNFGESNLEDQQRF